MLSSGSVPKQELEKRLPGPQKFPTLTSIETYWLVRVCGANWPSAPMQSGASALTAVVAFTLVLSDTTSPQMCKHEDCNVTTTAPILTMMSINTKKRS